MSRAPAPSWLPVVAAIITRNDALLLCQRAAGPHLPLLWEFPGGKVDAGEHPADALARELAEELGVAAHIGPLYHEVRHTYPEKRVWIRFYVAAIEGRPRPLIHRRVRWVASPELHAYPVPPANAPVVERIFNDGIGNLPDVR